MSCSIIQLKNDPINRLTIYIIRVIESFQDKESNRQKLAFHPPLFPPPPPSKPPFHRLYVRVFHCSEPRCFDRQGRATIKFILSLGHIPLITFTLRQWHFHFNDRRRPRLHASTPFPLPASPSSGIRRFLFSIELRFVL